MAGDATSDPIDVSVVIPTHNRRQSLLSVLIALDEQTIAPSRFEVVVVCDGCDDGSAEACAAVQTRYRKQVLEQPQQGPAAARNVAVAKASGDLLLFLDDDVVPAPNLIAEHVAAHDAAGDRTVGIGPLLAPAGFALAPWTRWEAATLRDQYAAMEAGKWRPSPRQFYTGNASVRREHVLSAGGFDPRFRRAEDVELAYRMQAMRLDFRFVPAAKGWHYARRSLRSWLDAARAYGAADVAMYTSGRLMTLQSMAAEFRWRNRWLRRLARAGVGRPFLLDPLVVGLLATARLAGWLRRTELEQSAYGAVFNLLYWDAVCAKLGGRAAFWDLIATGHGPLG